MSIRSSLVLSPILALAAGAALAQGACPVSGDLARGITIGFPDGATETYRQAQPGVVNVQGSNADGTRYRIELAQGMYLLLWEDPTSADSRQTYDYGVAPAAMAAPQPGGRQSFDVIATTVDGPRSEGQNHVNGQLVPMTIGGCTYQAMEVLIAFETSDAYMENIVFIPELGFSYLYWNESTGIPRSPVHPDRITVGAGK